MHVLYLDFDGFHALRFNSLMSRFWSMLWIKLEISHGLQDVLGGTFKVEVINVRQKGDLYLKMFGKKLDEYVKNRSKNEEIYHSMVLMKLIPEWLKITQMLLKKITGILPSLNSFD